MNKLLLLVLLTSTLFTIGSFTIKKVSYATFTGSKYCRACKNCKYCKHCAKEGGKCGVCSK